MNDKNRLIAEDFVDLIENIKNLQEISSEIVVASNKRGIEIFNKWEKETSGIYGQFKKIEINNDFLISDNIYIIPIKNEVKPVKIYFEK